MVVALVPAYNEARTIGSVVRNLFGYVDRVVVIDDASTDHTIDEAQRAGATVMHHRINRGQGAALETGHVYVRELGASIVIHFDADNQFDPAEIPGALQHLRTSGADILFGSRFLGEVSKIPLFKRMVLLPLARQLEKIATGVALTDVHNGFRILGPRALATIHLTQDRMAHATEIVFQAKRAHLKIIEHPITVRYHDYGQGIGGGGRILKELFFGKFIS